MQKVLYIILGILFIVLIAEGSYYALVVNKRKPATPTSIPTPTLADPLHLREKAIPTPDPNTRLVTLYQKPGDTNDRTLIYTSNNPLTLNNAGLTTTNPQMPYIVGLYDKKESIPGSTDYYVFLSNPLTQSPLDRVHIMTNAATSPYKTITEFGMELMSNLGLILINSPEHHLLQGNPIVDQTLFDATIQSGDTVIILPHIQENTLSSGKTGYTLVKDAQGYLIADVLAVRRINP